MFKSASSFSGLPSHKLTTLQWADAFYSGIRSRWKTYQLLFFSPLSDTMLSYDEENVMEIVAM